MKSFQLVLHLIFLVGEYFILWMLNLNSEKLFDTAQVFTHYSILEFLHIHKIGSKIYNKVINLKDK